MAFPINENSAKRTPPTALEIQQQKQAKLDDAASASMTKLDKSIARAHFVVGELVLKIPELFALVQPHIESRLSKESSAYKVVQENATKVTQVNGLQ